MQFTNKENACVCAKWTQEVANIVDQWKIRAYCEISARERFKVREYLL